MKRVLIGTVLLMLFVECAFFTTKNTSPESYCTTVGTIVSRDFSTTGDIYMKFEYYVGNKNYQGLCKEYLFWAPNGEKYLLEYHSLYPETPKYVGGLISGYPVFLPGEVTGYTYGKVIIPYHRDELIEFKYTVSGVDYTRIQIFEGRNALRKQPQVINGGRFLVEYLVENPQRAILYINKPRIDSLSSPSFSPDINVLRPVWDSIPVLLPNPQIIKSRPGWY